MNARIVEIGKRRWLAGMSWASYETVPSRAELTKDATNLNAAWVSVRVGEEAVQGGFCKPVEGVEAPGKLFSLAAMVADSREQPWLGIFEIEDGLYWYIAVRDGHAIMPDGDVIGGMHDIIEARERHTGYGDWNFVEGKLDLLEDFIAEIDAKPTRVRALLGPKKKQAKPLIAAAVAVAVAGSAGGFWYVKRQEAERIEAAEAMNRVRATLQAAEGQQAAKAPVAQGPNPNDWLAACRAVLYPAPLSKFGWLLTGVECDGGVAKVFRSAGEGATVANKPDGVVLDDGRKIEESIALAELKPAEGSGSIQLGEAQRLMRAWQQRNGFMLTFGDGAPPALPGSPDAAKAAVPTTSTVTIEMSTSPFKMNFGIFPGLRLTRIATTDAGWKVEGMIYGR